MTSIYIIGSLRNPEIPKIGNAIRAMGVEAFDDWFAAGPIADDSWQEYEKSRFSSYKDALQNYAAQHVYQFDLHHLNRVDAGLLVLPAGKSGHLELGFLAGQGKPTAILFDKEPERWDVMYNMAKAVYFSVEDMLEGLYFWTNERNSRF